MCCVHTRTGRIIEGTVQLCNASVHVNGQYGETKRSFDTVEAVLDEDVKTADETRALGVEVGDIVCFEPRTRITSSRLYQKPLPGRQALGRRAAGAGKISP